MKKEKDFEKEESIQDDSERIVGSDIADDVALDTFRTDSDNSKKNSNKRSKVRRGMTKRLTVMLVSFAVVFALLLTGYLVVIKPLYDEAESNNNPPKVPEPMIAGEVRGDDGYTILLYKHTDMAHTKKVTVVNPDPILGGKFTLVRDESNEEGTTFYVEEHGKYAPIKAETYLEIIVAAGYTVMSQRVAEDCTDLSVYGLAEEDYPRKVTIEDLDGNTNTFYIGALITSEGGYYCRAEGRNAVYILTLDSISCLINTSEGLLQPVLGPVIDGTSAFMMDFVLSKNGQRFVEIHSTEVDPEVMSQSSYEMVFPANYLVNDDIYGSDVLTKLATLEGYMVVAAGDGTPEGMLYKNHTLMAQFGFYDVENPLYEVYYELEDIAGYIMFTESGSDAYYYAYSLIWDTIVLVEKSSVSFLEWDLLEFINPRLFFEYIRDVSSLSVEGAFTYKGEQYIVNEKITYGYDENDDLVCTVPTKQTANIKYTGKSEKSNYALGFYMVALKLNVEGYISDAPNFSKDEKTERYAAFTIEFIDGEKRVYEFYKFGGYCYYTIDGRGEFYVSTSAVNSLMVNMLRVANNCYVDPDAEYPAPPDNIL